MATLTMRIVMPLALALTAAAPAGAQTYRGGMGMWHGSWGWGHMVAGGLMMLLFWGGLIALIVLLVRWLAGAGRDGGAGPPRSTALDILEERYARGEIGHEEFEERRRVLLTARADGRTRTGERKDPHGRAE